MTLATGRIGTIARFLGGQGTQNVPNWSPDGRNVAFVTYQLVPQWQRRSAPTDGRQAGAAALGAG